MNPRNKFFLGVPEVLEVKTNQVRFNFSVWHHEMPPAAILEMQ